jgi:hypothetical protein
VVRNGGTVTAQAQFSNRVRQQILTELKAAHKRIDIGNAGAELAEIALDPFGQGGRGEKGLLPVIPDGTSEASLGLTVTGTSTFSGATATSGIIQIIGPNKTDNGGYVVIYGNSASNPANSPTTTTRVYWREGTMATAMTTGYVRYVSAGIRVIAISASDDTAGQLSGFASRQKSETAAGVWGTYGSVLDDPFPGVHTVDKGITVRSYLDHEVNAFADRVAGPYALETSQSRMPVVMFTGLSAATSLSIEVVLHYEARVVMRTCPVRVAPSPTEPELAQLIHFINSQPMTVDGHSFSSFFKKIGAGLKAVFSFWDKNRGNITPLLQQLRLM